jgi:hypothetical protein
MNSNEKIDCANIGDMVPYQNLIKINHFEIRLCYTCGCRLSKYNDEKRCFPCRKNEKQITINALDDILSS